MQKATRTYIITVSGLYTCAITGLNHALKRANEIREIYRGCGVPVTIKRLHN